MKLSQVYILFFSLFLFLSCSSDNSTTTPDEEISLPPNEEETDLAPLAADLIFPRDNTECVEGEVESNEYSKITFEWNTSKNTDKYKLSIRNLLNNITTHHETETNTITLSILRGTPFEWYITSIANGNSNNAYSKRWQFYNAGVGEAINAPYPANLVYPLNKSVKHYGSDYLILRWEGSDLDNDILEYEIYFDSSENPTTLVAKLSDTEYYFWSQDYVLGTTYYWKIKTIDSKGNTSISQTYSCVVK
jgi:hypothetical protein